MSLFVKEWVEAAIETKTSFRDSKWTQSIAVGSQQFVENIKDVLGIHAKGRKVVGGVEGFQLKEQLELYNDDFNTEKDDIAPHNTYFWKKS